MSLHLRMTFREISCSSFKKENSRSNWHATVSPGCCNRNYNLHTISITESWSWGTVCFFVRSCRENLALFARSPLGLFTSSFYLTFSHTARALDPATHAFVVNPTNTRAKGGTRRHSKTYIDIHGRARACCRITPFSSISKPPLLRFHGWNFRRNVLYGEYSLGWHVASSALSEGS